MEEEDDELLYDYDACALSYSAGLLHPEDITNKLRRAIANDNVSAIQENLQNKHDINHVDNVGFTCLHTAVVYKSINALRYLISQEETRLDVLNHAGETPLMLSIKHNAPLEIITCLIKDKSTVNIPNYKNESPLHLAVDKEVIEIAHLLLENGADVDAKDFDGFTPLHQAIFDRNYNMVCMLLYYNASVNKDTFRMAIRSDLEIAALLKDYVDESSLKTLRSRIHIRDLDILEIFLDKNYVPRRISYIDISKLCRNTKTRLEWTWILLSFGVSVSFFHVQFLYEKYGFCPEIEAIFSSETTISHSLNHEIDFVREIIYGDLSYFSEIPGKNEYYAAISKGNIPSLLQLARDTCRIFIYKSQQTEANYKAYNAILRLNLPKRLEEILLLKRPIYS